MERVRVAVAPTYDVMIGRDILSQAGQLLGKQIEGKQVLIVTDKNIEAHHYLAKLTNTISEGAEQIHQYILPAGEAEKSMDNVKIMVEHLANLNFSRNDILIALGGGVIGDLVGFVASVYLRGVDFIQIPTTLLAAIDSSVGGKTAVDLPQGKNLVGAFHQPTVVLCDVDTFKTLPPAIFEDGCSELIKYGMIMSPQLLDQLLNMTQPLNAASKELVAIIKKCVEMKASVVQQDERDTGKRQLLNYGHTLGHAIEQASDYQISHGRSVAIGQSIMLRMATEEGYIKDNYTDKIDGLLKQYHLLERKPYYDFEILSAIMLRDKKRRRADITIVLPTNYGECQLFSLPLDEFLPWMEGVWHKYEIN